MQDPSCKHITERFCEETFRDAHPATTKSITQYNAWTLKKHNAGRVSGRSVPTWFPLPVCRDLSRLLAFNLI